MISTMLVGCRSLENHFIYNPSVYPSGWNKIEDDTIEEVNFQAGDGTQLHGLFAPHPEPKAIILFAHGRKGNVTSTLENLSQFIDRHQVSVMVFDYRGFGRSQGLPDEDGLYMDARAARKWLADRTGVVENDIIVMGHSLGAAVAVELAAADGAGGLIVEGGFTSLPLLVRRYAPIIPADLMLTSKFDSIEKIKNYTGPTLIAHGADDRIIPIKHGRKLFEAAGGEKRFLRIDGAGHTAKPTKNYQRAIDDLIQQSNTR
jgi:fermentation-respiration switch protein FrsA (DUF1100 family)